MKATRVQYCQMSVICPSNFWCVWQCDMMSDKNTCSPALKNRQINRWKTQLFFTDSIQPIDAVVLSSAAAACESSLGNKVLQVLKFFFRGMWILFLLLWIWCKFSLAKSLTKKISDNFHWYSIIKQPQITNLDFHEFLDHLEYLFKSMFIYLIPFAGNSIIVL